MSAPNKDDMPGSRMKHSCRLRPACLAAALGLFPYP